MAIQEHPEGAASVCDIGLSSKNHMKIFGFTPQKAHEAAEQPSTLAQEA